MTFIKNICVLITVALFSSSIQSYAEANNSQTCNSKMTTGSSAKLISNFSQCQLERVATTENISADKLDIAEKRNHLVQDIYRKAFSYKLINSIAFLTAITFAILVLLWPSLNVIFKKQTEDENSRWNWLGNATVQTTVTALAALSFTLYIQYKDKQTYSENLMRSIMFTNQDVAIEDLSIKVIDRMMAIDRGFSFGGVFGDATAVKGVLKAVPDADTEAAE